MVLSTGQVFLIFAVLIFASIGEFFQSVTKNSDVNLSLNCFAMFFKGQKENTFWPIRIQKKYFDPTLKNLITLHQKSQHLFCESLKELAFQFPLQLLWENYAIIVTKIARIKILQSNSLKNWLRIAKHLQSRNQMRRNQ